MPVTSAQEIEDRCAALEAENRRLADEMNSEGRPGFSSKDNVQHTNELLYLKGRIAELEKNLHSVGTYKPSISETNQKQNEDTALDELKKENLVLQAKVAELSQAVKLIHEKAVHETEEKDRERNSELSEKSMEYMTECERLRNDLKTLAADRTNIEARLQSKESEAKELHREVKSVIDKKRFVEGEAERLRAHLVQVEESYTQELMQGEEREQELRDRVGKLEDQVKRASMSHSEASQEANEATTHLTEALTAAASSRDSITEQLKVSQTKLREKTSALRNLQLALEGFQRQVRICNSH